jgi:hypothetical protein
MNFPIKPSDTQAQEILGSTNPIPIAAGGTGQSNYVDVRGYQWVEFIVEIVDVSGSITDLEAFVEYRDPATSTAQRVSIEDPDVLTGNAPQVDWHPMRANGGVTPFTWRFPVPVHGTQMRIDAFADSGATPDAASTITISALRRN